MSVQLIVAGGRQNKSSQEMAKMTSASSPDDYVAGLSGWQRVLFGFWRGKRLQSIEPRLKASGKYEMATLELREGMSVSAAVARRLTKEAIRLNASLGDPRDLQVGL